MPENPETLVEQRIAQLETISERRNALLREMYHLLKRRENVGTVLNFDDSEEGDLHVFLNRFNMKTDPQSGHFSSLPENELFGLVPPSTKVLVDSSRSSSVGNVESPSKNQSPPVERSESPVALPQPALESDDELNLIGTSEPASIHASPAATHTDRIFISNPPEEEQVLMLGEARGNDDTTEAMVEPLPPTRTSPPPVATPKVAEEAVSPSAPASEDTSGEGQPSAQVEVIESSFELNEVAADVIEPKDTDDMVVDTIEASPAPQQVTAPPQTHESPTHSEERGRSVEVNNDMIVDESIVPSPQPAKDLDQTLPLTEATEPQNVVPEVTVRPADLFMVPMDIRSEPMADIVPSRPVFIPFPSSSYHSWDSVQFPSDFGVDKNQSEPAAPSNRVRFNVEADYPLPPIKSLPLEFNPNKKGKYAKQKRKEREKAEKAGGQINKEEWTPWGFNRWIITIKTNPLYKRVSKSTKCLTTRDWSIAMNELKLLRTAERVEYLKAKGRWSFRQPKKQRGVGGSTKSHWDYLLEEMKWMRTDFREERKWKMAIAYNLSTAVLEWHAASGPQERVEKGICVLWKPPRQDEQVLEEADDVEMVADSQENDDDNDNENTGSQNSPEKSIVDYGSEDDEDDEPDKDQDQSVVDALDETTRLEEALALQESGQSADVGLKDLEPKKEEIDDPHALEDGNTAVDGVGSSTQSQDVKHSVGRKSSATSGLKSTSNDPLLGTKSNTHSSEPNNLHSKSQKRNLYAPIREQVAYSEIDQLFLDLDDFHISSAEDSQQKDIPHSILPPSDLSDIFPDMQPYGLLDVAPPTIPEGKKKSDKKSEQDPNKRVEETERTKLMPASKFMYTKPTLIGALDPAHHFMDGQWTAFDDTPVTVEYEGPPSRGFGEEFANKLFDPKPTTTQIVTPAFPGPSASQGPQSPTKDKSKERRSLDHLWSANDDTLLRSLIDKYPNSWDLIAECFNATRKAVATDVRTSRDCQERWRELWEQEQIRQRQEAGSAIDATPPPASSSTGMATRGVKRLASASVSSTIGPVAGSETKRRRRHILIQDTVRKAVKKRAEAVQKANVKKPPVLHDTHMAFSKLAKFSPAELSRMKVEQELRQSQEMQLRTRMSQQGRPPAAGQAQAAQAVPVAGAAPPNGVNRPPAPAAAMNNQNVVPAIRSQQQAQVPISQQQRAGTPLVAGQARMSPQQQQQQQQLLQQVQQQARPQQAQTTQQQQQQQQLVLSQQQALAAALAQVHNAQVHNAAAAAAAQAANGTGASVSNAPPNANGTSTGAQAAHLPAAYAAIANASRDATSSPAHTSPPPSRTSATPVSVNSPAQPQTQPLQPTQQNGQVGVVGLPRPSIQYYLPPNMGNYSPEQVQMLMMQMYQHQAQQAQQHQQQQAQQQHHPQQQHQQPQNPQQAGQQQNSGFNSNQTQ